MLIVRGVETHGLFAWEQIRAVIIPVLLSLSDYVVRLGQQTESRIFYSDSFLRLGTISNQCGREEIEDSFAAIHIRTVGAKERYWKEKNLTSIYSRLDSEKNLIQTCTDLGRQ